MFCAFQGTFNSNLAYISNAGTKSYRELNSIIYDMIFLW